MKYQGKDVFINISSSHSAEEKLNMLRYETPCSVYGCTIGSISHCHFCMKSYCNEHINIDLHNLKNMAILSQLKMIN